MITGILIDKGQIDTAIEDLIKCKELGAETVLITCSPSDPLLDNSGDTSRVVLQGEETQLTGVAIPDLVAVGAIVVAGSRLGIEEAIEAMGLGKVE